MCKISIFTQYITLFGGKQGLLVGFPGKYGKGLDVFGKWKYNEKKNVRRRGSGDSTSKVNLEHKTILVTGAAGFIGANLGKRICGEIPSAQVVGIDNLNDYYDVALKEYRLKELENILLSHFTGEISPISP